MAKTRNAFFLKKIEDRSDMSLREENLAIRL